MLGVHVCGIGEENILFLIIFYYWLNITTFVFMIIYCIKRVAVLLWMLQLLLLIDYSIMRF